jgi:putative polyhydroxyalkanoate system protein
MISAVPRFEITQPHHVSPEEARQRLERLSADLQERYGLVPVWVSPTVVEVRRSGASGTLRIEPDRIRVQVDLSFVLTPLRAEIESRIRRELVDLFAA